MSQSLRVAVVGGGISGLAAAHRLSAAHQVTLFEAADRLGGHANTIDITLDGITHPVDTGFLVYNERTYPGLISLFDALEVPTARSDMSFSVSVGPHRFEWCGSSLASLFAQPSNMLSPRFWRMLADILRFNRAATALARPGHDDQSARTPLGEYLSHHRYGEGFINDYLLPMAAAIWSCPTRTMLGFPTGSFARFFDNHGLLQIANRPQWFTVRGGSREYVSRIAATLQDVRVATPVRSVLRGDRRVTLLTDSGAETFDALLLATHSDQSLAMLSDADDDERAVLGAIPYQPNRAWVHTDPHLMPARRGAWAAWNYLSAGTPADANTAGVSVTYWLNRLQPLPFATPVLVSLNPLHPPEPSHTLATIDYSHPVFDIGALDAQQRLGTIQGRRRTWFAGAWTGYGFHEDGLQSGLAAAHAIDSGNWTPPRRDGAGRTGESQCRDG